MAANVGVGLNVALPHASTKVVASQGALADLYRRAFSNISQILLTTGTVVAGTHVARKALDIATAPDGTTFYETDRDVFYVIQGGVWAFGGGEMFGTAANAPTDLGTGDAGFLYRVTDFGHRVQWGGAAWVFAAGDDGPGWFAPFAMAPPATGWALCDGSNTTYLTVGATLGSTLFATPALTTNPAYIKSGAAYDPTLVTAGGNLTGGGAVDPVHFTGLIYFRR